MYKGFPLGGTVRVLRTLPTATLHHQHINWKPVKKVEFWPGALENMLSLTGGEGIRNWWAGDGEKDVSVAYKQKAVAYN
jgi:hypothetical protein